MSLLALRSSWMLLMFCTLLSCNRQQSVPRFAPSAKPAAPGSWIDSDADGIPDSGELTSFNDRANFRTWFSAIAEMQFYRFSPSWSVEQRDCAGLVRFAWREALRSHDRQWFRTMGEGYEPWCGDVRAYSLESAPFFGKLFRADSIPPGPGRVSPEMFSVFADAHRLLAGNCSFVSRDRARAQQGDLLFFYQPWVPKFPYHVMLFLGPAFHDGEGASDWVVYHTGAAPEDGGTVKKVRLAVLDHHPDKRWRPLASNGNFLGFYRLNILQ
jgi:uncharacterized protein YfaT (DUF1175 family)